MSRSPREVLEDHLARAAAGDLDGDLDRNVSPEIVILSSHGVHRGHEGVRELARLLAEEIPEVHFHYLKVLVEGELAFLEWEAHGDGARVEDGADSYLIRDGKIVAQTIHYTVHKGRNRPF